MVGKVGVGGDNPIRIQSMTTTDTMDTKSTIEQSMRMIDASIILIDCSMVDFVSIVSVVVIDCILMGLSPPTPTFPTMTSRVLNLFV